MNSFAAHSFTPPPLKPRHSSTRINVLFLVSVYLVIATSISFELVATTQFLALLSGALLLSVLASIYLSKTEGIFSPLVLFSATYSGYAIGGLYYSQSGDYFGKFIGFLNIDKAQIELSLQYSLLFAITCYIFFALGYLAFRPKKEINFICHTSPFVSFLGKYYFFLSFPLLTAGFIYWLWVAFSIAGGPINLVLYFQAFRHLISETSTNYSSVPYLFCWHLFMAYRGNDQQIANRLTLHCIEFLWNDNDPNSGKDHVGNYIRICSIDFLRSLNPIEAKKNIGSICCSHRAFVRYLLSKDRQQLLVHR